MAYYLIDYENKKALQGLSDLTENDTVIFFYTGNSNTMTFSLHQEIIRSAARFEYKEVKCGGKNSLDFQLSAYLGYLMAKTVDEHFYIVSADKGFSNVVDFMKATDSSYAAIERVEGIARAKENEPVEESAEEKSVSVKEENGNSQYREKLEKLGITSDSVDKIFDIINQFKTKLAINNNLMKHFKDSEKVGKITKIIRPLLKSKS